MGQTFAAALVPGLIMVAIYILYILGRAFLVPGDAPAMQRPEKSVSHAEIFGAVAPPILLIIAVLGGDPWRASPRPMRRRAWGRWARSCSRATDRARRAG